MEWADIAAVCQREWELLRSDDLPDLSTFFPDASTALSTLLRHEQETTEEVEAAVRTFSANRTWPALSDLERTMLCLRLEYAVSLASLLAEQPPWSAEGTGDDPQTGMEWLLLFAWGEHGFPTLQRTLEQFLRPTEAPR